jgi:murein DD-endopeptidase MepM/ murein hydrolase activator NlpD
MSIESLNLSTATMSAQQTLTEDDLRGKDMDQAAEQFESYMVELMVKEMRKNIPKGMFQNNATELFGGVMDQELAKQIAAGGGMGFAKMLTTDHSQFVESAHRANSVRLVPHGMEQRIDHAEDMSLSLDSAALPVDGVITSRFGRRSDPFHGRNQKHKGIDIAAPRGAPIQPLRPGTVLSAGKRGGFGNVVVVDHGDGLTSLYAHCDKLKVKAGDSVGAGDVIATVGSTGRSTGPHLHLEVHRDGRAIDPAQALGLPRGEAAKVAKY